MHVRAMLEEGIGFFGAGVWVVVSHPESGLGAELGSFVTTAYAFDF